MSIWSGRAGLAIDYGIPAFAPGVELRKRVRNGCAERSQLRLSDPVGPCWVCGHRHLPASMGDPFCVHCAIAEIRMKETMTS